MSVILGVHCIPIPKDTDGEIAHDSAAVLLVDGVLVAAAEEERFVRLKHCGFYPLHSINFCLGFAGLTMNDVDFVACDWSFETTSPWVKKMEFVFGMHENDRKMYLAEALDVDPNKIIAVGHHLSHAASAVFGSGFYESLVVVMDGSGDGGESMTIFESHDGNLKVLKQYKEEVSLGNFYGTAAQLLGYEGGMYDCYKVMGLAPYGNADDVEPFLESTFSLCEHGEYMLDFGSAWCNLVGELLGKIPKNREFTQVQKNFAAWTQRAFEKLVFHVLTHFRTVTNLSRLCLAGGAAHNCTLTGKLLCSDLFSNVWVHPASHDAGTALGCAQELYFRLTKQFPSRFESAFLGTPIPSGGNEMAELREWQDVLSIQDFGNDGLAMTAKLLASGSVLGWVAGRAEFGPRALGNRSILADPRPRENTERINAMIKKRESYRPFAPIVQEEHLASWFEVSGSIAKLPFMNFVLKVKKSGIVLGATTHVDGTARVQTVSREDNTLIWQLLAHFSELANVPVLLNTSFNNNHEPIVDSLCDALNCFLTTNLDHLIINGRFCLTLKRERCWAAYKDFYILRHPSAQLLSAGHAPNIDSPPFTLEMGWFFHQGLFKLSSKAGVKVPCSFAVLGNPLLTVSALIPDGNVAHWDCLMELWDQRLVRLSPNDY